MACPAPISHGYFSRACGECPTPSIPGVFDAEGEATSSSVPKAKSGHRPHVVGARLPWNACVARSVGKREIETNPKAQAALKKEWDRLRAIKCWDESVVREWTDVAREAKQSQSKAHIGRIFAVCVEKNSELPDSDPSRKFKGRVVFQGSNVKDENWDWAIFQELASCPATMEAAKAADAYGCCPGHIVETADAAQLYPIQAWRNPDLGRITAK